MKKILAYGNNPEQKLPPLPGGEHPWARELRSYRRILGVCELVLSVILTAALLVRPAFQLAISLPFTSLWIRALVYAAILSMAYGVMLLPLGFVRSYVLEKAFGLSTQTLGAWVSDQIKGLLLGAVLSAMIVFGVTASLVWTGANWWWVTALGAVVFGVVLTRLAPQLILPLFFKLKPLDSPELQRRFHELAEKTKTPALGVFEIDLSRRTKAANAAVIGFGATRKAVVGDTLLAEFSLDEVEFVLAHELAHHHYHDLWSGIGISGLIFFCVLFLTHQAIVYASSYLNVEFPVQSSNDFNPILLFWIAIVGGVLRAGLNPIAKAFSRFVEARSDRFAAKTTNKARAGAEAFKKLGYQNLAVFRPPVWEELLLYTHPSISRRIEALTSECNPASLQNSTETQRKS